MFDEFEERMLSDAELELAYEMLDWSNSDNFRKHLGMKTKVLFPKNSPLVVKAIEGDGDFSGDIFLKGYQQSEDLFRNGLVAPFLMRRFPQDSSRGLIIQQKVKSLIERLDKADENEGIELARQIGELDNNIVRFGKIPVDNYFDNLGLIGEHVVVSDCGRVIHKYSNPFPGVLLPGLSADAFDKINLQCGRGNVIYSRGYDLKERFGDDAFKSYKKGLGLFLSPKVDYRFTQDQYEKFRSHLATTVEDKEGSQEGDSVLIAMSRDLETTLEELSQRISGYHHDVKQGLGLNCYEEEFRKVATSEISKYYGKGFRRK